MYLYGITVSNQYNTNSQITEILYGIRASPSLTEVFFSILFLLFNMGDDLSITKTPAITPSITSPGTSGDGSAQIISFHPASQLPIKLTGSGNFPTWKAQVYTLMCGYDLLDFLEGSNPVPAVSSSAYRLWFRQDNLIRNALIASADPTIAPTIASSKTSKQAWDYLHTT